MVQPMRRRGIPDAWFRLAVVACIHLVMPEASAAVKREPKMSFLENDGIRLGADLAIGGSITHLSTRAGPNMVNSHDWGRQIQMSFYSGPQPFEPGGKKPNSHWEQLGWNPIQSGDAYGNASKVLEHKNDGKDIYVKCRPMHWPLNNQPGQCTFECWYRIEGNTVHVRSRLTNARDDKTQYRGRNQELPALYSNGPWYRIVTYTGSKPFTNDATVEISRKPERPPFPWNRFQATEEWAALVDTDGNGFGVWSPGAQEYLGGFAGRPGKGGPKSSPTCYVSPLHTEILDHNIEYTYEYKLIVGSVKNIRAYVYKNRSKSKGLNYTFKSDRRHWYYINATDKGLPIKNGLDIELAANNPRVVSPWFCIQARDVKTIQIRGAFATGENQARIAWVRHGSRDFAKGDVVNFRVQGNGSVRTYTIPLSRAANWKGTVTRLALIPCRKGGKGKRLRLGSIQMR